MATLKGQNLRILVLDGTDFKVVAKSTNCTVTLTGNTDDSSTKDDVGMASKPEITSKSWGVQVESLDVTDTAAMLNGLGTYGCRLLSCFFDAAAENPRILFTVK